MKRAELSEKDTWSRCEGEDSRVGWKNVSRSSPQQRETHAIHQRGSVEENKWIWTRPGRVSHLSAGERSRCRWKCLSRKGFETEEERWRSWRGCFILKGVKKEKKKKRCSYRDDWEAIKKERRPVFSLTCLPVTACDGGGVMCQADDGSWAASTIKTCLSAQPLCSILWKVKMGGVHIVCVCVCVCVYACMCMKVNGNVVSLTPSIERKLMTNNFDPGLLLILAASHLTHKDDTSTRLSATFDLREWDDH